MSLDHKIRFIAGTVVSGSLALAWLINPLWLILTGFVGLNLIQSAFTKWCLMEDILRATGVHREVP